MGVGLEIGEELLELIPGLSLPLADDSLVLVGLRVELVAPALSRLDVSAHDLECADVSFIVDFGVFAVLFRISDIYSILIGVFILSLFG